MLIRDLGEFGLIDQIKKWISAPGNKILKLGIGDDAAVLNYSKRQYLLLSCDTLIEDSHFKLNQIKPSFLGAKSLLVNLSDIFAMGGAPKFALINLGLPKNITTAWVKGFYRGIKKIAARFGVAIIGGDTVCSPKRVMISVTVIGEAAKNQLLLRSKAKAGDYIAVTGSFGLAAANDYRILPELRQPELKVLIQKRLASAMIDCSDGLVTSIRQICEASGVGAEIELAKVPKARGVTLEQALYGGEDYELVFTVPAPKVKALKGFSVIGRVVKKNKGVRLVTFSGKRVKPKPGFEHFK